MKIASLESTPVSVAYTHRERSSQVNRDGVSDIVVKAVTTDVLAAILPGPEPVEERTHSHFHFTPTSSS